ncbi:MAG TPA: pilus assembly protein PilX [Ramlibacter sp.]
MHTVRTHRHKAGRPHGLQRGISLIFALMALVVLGLGAVALTRSVDTGTLIMGNLSFRQDAVVASSQGAEEALTWLAANVKGTTLDKNDATKGYYSYSLDDHDITGNLTSSSKKYSIIDWDGNCLGLPSTAYEKCTFKPFTGTTVNGNKVKWIITRMCDQADMGSAAPNFCMRPAAGAGATAKEKGELKPGGRFKGGLSSPYFRVVVRVEGPRNTVSYTETLVHF